MLAAGSTDFSLKVVTCFIEDEGISCEVSHTVTQDTAYNGPFSKVKTWGEILIAMQDLEGWVNDIWWSPTSDEVIAAMHHNHLVVKRVQEGENKP